MRDAIHAFLIPDEATGPVQLKMLGINQSLSNIRNKTAIVPVTSGQIELLLKIIKNMLVILLALEKLNNVLIINNYT
jgi:hypothetical protein